MAYQATVIPVMIASPGDVLKERNIIRTVIHDWNDVNAAGDKVMLTPVGWETHSSPELGARPQELINSRILKDCDLLIGVFWTRLGTPTGKAKSGTVEEIEEHIAAGKPAMIYFSSKRAVPDSIDPQQHAEVQAFKKWCKTQGIVEEFGNAAQFKNKFTKQLQACLISNKYIHSLITSLADSPSRINPKIELSDAAKILLKAAASRDDGMITTTASMGGKIIFAGNNFFGSESRRELAKWEHAFNELVSLSLVAKRENTSNYFELTYKGWGTANALQ